MLLPVPEIFGTVKKPEGWLWCLVAVSVEFLYGTGITGTVTTVTGSSSATLLVGLAVVDGASAVASEAAVVSTAASFPGTTASGIEAAVPVAAGGV